MKYLISRFFEEGMVVGLHRLKYRLLSPSHKAATSSWLGQHRGNEVSDDAFFEDLGYRVPLDAKDRQLLIGVLDDSLSRKGPLPANAEDRITQLTEQHPAERRETIALADAILAGDLSWLVTDGPVSSGFPPWHRAYGKGPGQLWPLCPPAEMAPETFPGDVRISWEIGRQQYLIHLAQAWLYTRNPDYGKAVIAHILDWIEQNPFGLGIHWWHAQESALRIKAWLWAVGAVLSCPDVQPEQRLRIYKSLWQQTLFTLKTRSASPVTHNHLLTELFGSSQFMMTFPQFALSRKWENQVHADLETEIEKQFWEDGSPGEGSVNYHLFILESAVEWTAHRTRLNLPIETKTRERIRAMTGVASSWIRPDGSWPQIGDSDSGRGFCLSTKNASSRRGTLDAAQRLMSLRPSFPDNPSPEALWLCEDLAIHTQPGTEEHPSPGTGTIAGIGGIHGRGAVDSHVTFATGPTAFRKGVSLSHLHAHALSLCWWVDGQEILIDPGTGHYNLSMTERCAFRKSSHHSTLTVFGEDHFDVSTLRFGVERPRLSRWIANHRGPGWYWRGASTPATTSLPGANIEMERHFIHVPEGPALLIFDRWEEHSLSNNTKEAPFEQWFQFGNLHADPLPDAKGATLYNADNEALAAFHLSKATKFETIKGDPETWGPGNHSPDYGTVCAGEALRVAHAPKPGGGACSQSVFAPVGSFLKVEEEKLSLFLTESDAPLITVIMDPKGRPLHVRKDHNPEEMEPHE